MTFQKLGDLHVIEGGKGSPPERLAAALAVIARGGTRETPSPEPGPGRVVLAK